ncbi:MAG: EamA family transporter, partial [Candidatus Komeilibacteria bacterium]|nr:EamA family transporter [Candidatus Komeilibacteria bacterium]
MNWIVIVITGHLLNALAFLMDKFLLTKKVPSPFAYAFFIGLFGIVAAALIPFGFSVPAVPAIMRALLGGATFVLALIFFFAALKENEASRVVPLSGGLVPGFTIIFAYFLLDERLALQQLIAFAALVLGGILITIETNRQPKKQASSNRGYLWALVSAVIFALSSVIMKIVFNEQAFISGFVWSRIGGFLAALLILLIPAQRYQIFHP